RHAGQDRRGEGSPHSQVDLPPGPGSRQCRRAAPVEPGELQGDRGVVGRSESRKVGKSESRKAEGTESERRSSRGGAVSVRATFRPSAFPTFRPSDLPAIFPPCPTPWTTS